MEESRLSVSVGRLLGLDESADLKSEGDKIPVEEDLPDMSDDDQNGGSVK